MNASRRGPGHRRGGGRGSRHGWEPGPPRGHRARRGDVRSAALSLLAERPMHGYEMIQELEERSGGRWRPSAGSIYPTLQLLSDEGLVKDDEVDGKRVFSLTKEGEEAAAAIAERRKSWEENGEDSPFHRLRTAAFQVGGAAKQVAHAGDEAQVEKTVEVLTDARRKIYSILAES